MWLFNLDPLPLLIVLRGLIWLFWRHFQEIAFRWPHSGRVLAEPPGHQSILHWQVHPDTNIGQLETAAVLLAPSFIRKII